MENRPEFMNSQAVNISYDTDMTIPTYYQVSADLENQAVPVTLHVSDASIPSVNGLHAERPDVLALATATLLQGSYSDTSGYIPVQNLVLSHQQCSQFTQLGSVLESSLIQGSSGQEGIIQGHEGVIQGREDIIQGHEGIIQDHEGIVHSLASHERLIEGQVAHVALLQRQAAQDGQSGSQCHILESSGLQGQTTEMHHPTTGLHGGTLIQLPTMQQQVEAGMVFGGQHGSAGDNPLMLVKQTYNNTSDSMVVFLNSSSSCTTTLTSASDAVQYTETPVTETFVEKKKRASRPRPASRKKDVQGNIGSAKAKPVQTLPPDGIISSEDLGGLEMTSNTIIALMKKKFTKKGLKINECPYCKKGLSSREALRTHLRTHTGERPYQCEDCGKSFSDCSVFRRHQRIHTGEKPYVCDICGKAFNQSTSLESHKRTHTGTKKYTCEVCGLGFDKLQQLVDHCKTENHGNMKTYKCPKCSVEVQDEVTLKRHMCSHTGERAYTCHICGAKWEKQYGLMEHLRMHAGIRPYDCPDCDERFVRKGDLRVHLSRHSVNRFTPHKCQTCGEGFKQKAQLMVHERIHTGVKPYGCKACGKCFYSWKDLREHRRKHSGKRIYKCDLCGKTFATMNTLKIHVKMHMKTGAISCSTCSKTFHDTNDFVHHTRFDHSANMENVGNTDSSDMDDAELSAIPAKKKRKVVKHAKKRDDSKLKLKKSVSESQKCSSSSEETSSGIGSEHDDDDDDDDDASTLDSFNTEDAELSANKHSSTPSVHDNGYAADDKQSSISSIQNTFNETIKFRTQFVQNNGHVTSTEELSQEIEWSKNADQSRMEMSDFGRETEGRKCPSSMTQNADGLSDVQCVSQMSYSEKVSGVDNLVRASVLSDAVSMGIQVTGVHPETSPLITASLDSTSAVNSEQSSHTGGGILVAPDGASRVCSEQFTLLTAAHSIPTVSMVSSLQNLTPVGPNSLQLICSSSLSSVNGADTTKNVECLTMLSPHVLQYVQGVKSLMCAPSCESRTANHEEDSVQGIQETDYGRNSPLETNVEEMNVKQTDTSREQQSMSHFQDQNNYEMSNSCVDKLQAVATITAATASDDTHYHQVQVNQNQLASDRNNDADVSLNLANHDSALQAQSQISEHDRINDEQSHMSNDNEVMQVDVSNNEGKVMAESQASSSGTVPTVQVHTMESSSLELTSQDQIVNCGQQIPSSDCQDNSYMSYTKYLTLPSSSLVENAYTSISSVKDYTSNLSYSLQFPQAFHSQTVANFTANSSAQETKLYLDRGFSSTAYNLPNVSAVFVEQQPALNAGDSEAIPRSVDYAINLQTLINTSLAQEAAKVAKDLPQQRKQDKGYSRKFYKSLECQYCGKGLSSVPALKNHEMIHTGERPYKCDCGKSFIDSSTFKRHQRIHTGIKPYMCDVCGKQFNQSNSYRTHMTCHTGEKHYKCNVCGHSFDKLKKLMDHNQRENHGNLKKHTCSVCSAVFRDVASLDRHMCSHTGEKAFKCEYCNKTYEKQYQFNEHMHSHAGFKPFKCDVCGDSFLRKGQLKFHVYKHQYGRQFECEFCHQAFYRSTDLIVHRRIHTGERPFKCNQCDRSFRQKWECKNHQLWDHSTEKPFTCDKCFKTFKKSYSLKLHMQNKHENEKRHKCFVCKKRFRKLENLKKHARKHRSLNCRLCDKNFLTERKTQQHMEKFHKNDKRVMKITKRKEKRKLECSECGKKFCFKYDLEEHTRLHTGESIYKCTICSKIFSREYHLNIHTMKHTGEKRFKCDECGEPFTSGRKLKNHRIEQHGASEADIFKCAICQREFSDRNTMKKHVKSHSSEKPYECQTCGRRYQYSWNLKIHEKSAHTGDMPFKCRFCQKMFTHRRDYRDHVRSHTDNLPFKCHEARCGRSFASQRALRMHQPIHFAAKCVTPGSVSAVPPTGRNPSESGESDTNGRVQITSTDAGNVSMQSYAHSYHSTVDEEVQHINNNANGGSSVSRQKDATVNSKLEKGIELGNHVQMNTEKQGEYQVHQVDQFSSRCLIIPPADSQAVSNIQQCLVQKDTPTMRTENDQQNSLQKDLPTVITVTQGVASCVQHYHQKDSSTMNVQMPRSTNHVQHPQNDSPTMNVQMTKSTDHAQHPQNDSPTMNVQMTRSTGHSQHPQNDSPTMNVQMPRSTDHAQHPQNDSPTMNMEVQRTISYVQQHLQTSTVITDTDLATSHVRQHTMAPTQYVHQHYQKDFSPSNIETQRTIGYRQHYQNNSETISTETHVRTSQDQQHPVQTVLPIMSSRIATRGNSVVEQMGGYMPLSYKIANQGDHHHVSESQSSPFQQSQNNSATDEHARLQSVGSSNVVLLQQIPDNQRREKDSNRVPVSQATGEATHSNRDLISQAMGEATSQSFVISVPRTSLIASPTVETILLSNAPSQAGSTSEHLGAAMADYQGQSSESLNPNVVIVEGNPINYPVPLYKHGNTLSQPSTRSHFGGHIQFIQSNDKVYALSKSVKESTVAETHHGPARSAQSHSSDGPWNRVAEPVTTTASTNYEPAQSSHSQSSDGPWIRATEIQPIYTSHYAEHHSSETNYVLRNIQQSGYHLESARQDLQSVSVEPFPSTTACEISQTDSVDVSGISSHFPPYIPKYRYLQEIGAQKSGIIARTEQATEGIVETSENGVKKCGYLQSQIPVHSVSSVISQAITRASTTISATENPPLSTECSYSRAPFVSPAVSTIVQNQAPVISGIKSELSQPESCRSWKKCRFVKGHSLVDRSTTDRRNSVQPVYITSSLGSQTSVKPVYTTSSNISQTTGSIAGNTCKHFDQPDPKHVNTDLQELKCKSQTAGSITSGTYTRFEQDSDRIFAHLQEFKGNSETSGSVPSNTYKHYDQRDSENISSHLQELLPVGHSSLLQHHQEQGYDLKGNTRCEVQSTTEEESSNLDAGDLISKAAVPGDSAQWQHHVANNRYSEEPDAVANNRYSEEPDAVENNRYSGEPDAVENNRYTEEPDAVANNRYSEEPDAVANNRYSEEPDARKSDLMSAQELLTVISAQHQYKYADETDNRPLYKFLGDTRTRKSDLISQQELLNVVSSHQPYKYAEETDERPHYRYLGDVDNRRPSVEVITDLTSQASDSDTPSTVSTQERCVTEYSGYNWTKPVALSAGESFTSNTNDNLENTIKQSEHNGKTSNINEKTNSKP
ncbi:uncharacterized protein LOC121385813 [Gigantopelta aegis]|uniref:uncharacterized protein LOC121385813 n=1 Tax=Gigantopelta aegis TaxID=1735272 RepID=UPI001B8895AE|nr:uncharacterized protein LOC121385813 [Gigantopelta aegis]